MLPTREEAEKLLLEAEGCNPGPWGNHSRIAAFCAEKIALACQNILYIDSKWAIKEFGKSTTDRRLAYIC